MRYGLVGFVAMVLCLSGCGDDAASGEAGDAAPATAKPPAGDPRDLPKVEADTDAIHAMLRERFGEAITRNIRIGVDDELGGVRVRATGEVPNEEVRVAVMDELSARVEGLKFEDFNLAVAGPLPLLWDFEAPVNDSNFAVFSPDLSLVATQDGELFETATGRRLNRLALHGQPEVRSVAFSPDGKLLATGHSTGQILLWDMPLGATHKVLAPSTGLTATRPVVAMQFTGDGRSLVTINREHGDLHLWDLARGSARLIGAHQPEDASHQGTDGYVLAVSPDGKTIATANDIEDGIRLWDVPGRKVRDTLTGELFHPEAAAWSRDGRYLAVARFNEPESGTVLVWDMGSKERKAFVPDTTQGVQAIAFSDDGRTLVTRYARGQGMRLWDVEAGTKWIDIGDDKVGTGRGVRFSSDGAVLATECSGLSPARVRLWDVSRRPGASNAKAKLPPAIGESVTPRDDLLAQTLEATIRGTFDPRNVQSLTVTVAPDGSVRLTGKVSSPSVRDHAGRQAETGRAGNDPASSPPRRVINELEVMGRYEAER